MRIDFYLLPTATDQQRQHFACRLAEKAWHKNLRIYMQTENIDVSQTLDQLLWSFNNDSFIPHRVDGTDNPAEQAILISHEPCSGDFDLLINLSTQFINVQTVKRVAEIIHQDEAAKQRGREHYKRYREQQCELHHHEINEP